MTVNLIKQAALVHFAKKGYDGTSLAQIAEDVGIRKQSIATYFTKKEDLYISVFQQFVQSYVLQMKDLKNEIATKSVERKLQTILYQGYEYRLKHPEQNAFYKQVVHFPPAFLQAKIQDEIMLMEQQTSIIYAEVFKEGIQTGVIKKKELADLLAAFYCLIDGISMQMTFYEEDEFHQRLSSIWSFFWDGIKQI